MTKKNAAIPDDMPMIATTHQILEWIRGMVEAMVVAAGVIAVDGQVEDVAMANNPVLIVSIVEVKYVEI